MLTEHFGREEFEKERTMPEDCIPIFTVLCAGILEPVRAQFGPVDSTSGYRSVESNAAAHGQPNSEHMATPDYCADDFKIVSLNGDMRPVFDWMRNNPKLPFHQLILEHEDNGHTIIHVSINKLKPGLRSCKEGHTNNRTPYVDVECVPFEPGDSAT